MIIGLIFFLPLFQTRKRFRDCSLRVFALGMQASPILLFAIRFFISSGGPAWSCISVLIVVLQANQLEEETRKLTKMLDRFRINATQVVIAVTNYDTGCSSSCSPPPLLCSLPKRKNANQNSCSKNVLNGTLVGLLVLNCQKGHPVVKNLKSDVS